MVELSKFFELTSDLMCVLDENGRFLSINPAFREALGYSDDQVQGRLLSDLAHPDDKAISQAKLKQLIEKHTGTPFSNGGSPSKPHLAGRYVRQSGECRWLSWNLMAVDSTLHPVTSGRDRQRGEPVLYCCTGRDVTALTAAVAASGERYSRLLEIKQAAHERAERASHEAQLYAEAVQNMPVGLYIWRMENLDDVNSWTLVDANSAASTLTGVPAEEILGKSLPEAFPALVETELPDICAEVVRSGESIDLGDVADGDGRVGESLFDIKAFPLSHHCLGLAFENVTARKQTEAIGREQAIQLKILFDRAAVGMARLSSDGHWIQVNQKLCDLLGYTMPELLGKTFPDVTHPEDVADDAAIYQQLLTGELSHTSFEKRYLTKQGEVVWAYVTVSTSRNDVGGLLYFIATIQDITVRKTATQALQKQKNDLLTVNLMLTDTMSALEQRNQELDQFAYVTSHDLKAPLRAIANLATWIEEDIGETLPPENVEQFELLKSRVHRMEGLIDGLLEYSRVGRKHQNHERVDVGQMLAGIVDLLSPSDDFTVEILPPMPVLEAKKAPLAQIFSNLISNAIKHHDRQDGQVQISARELDNFYEFEITDDGPGIDSNYHQKVFTIFQTLRARDDLESTGIGLSIVKKAVTAEGGQIFLESSAGEGATFRFTWPKTPRQIISLSVVN